MCHSVITIPDHTDTLCHLHHTKLRKWIFIFLNSYQWTSPISTTEEFLNLCQDGTNASMCLGNYAEEQVEFRAIHDNTWHLIPTGVVGELNLHNMPWLIQAISKFLNRYLSEFNLISYFYLITYTMRRQNISDKICKGKWQGMVSLFKRHKVLAAFALQLTQ